jgi:hypothetical protein
MRFVLSRRWHRRYVDLLDASDDYTDAKGRVHEACGDDAAARSLRTVVTCVGVHEVKTATAATAHAVARREPRHRRPHRARSRERRPSHGRRRQTTTSRDDGAADPAPSAPARGRRHDTPNVVVLSGGRTDDPDDPGTSRDPERPTRRRLTRYTYAVGVLDRWGRA